MKSSVPPQLSQEGFLDFFFGAPFFAGFFFPFFFFSLDLGSL